MSEYIQTQMMEAPPFFEKENEDDFIPKACILRTLSSLQNCPNEFYLSQGIHKIGRSQNECSVYIPHESVSANHACIEVEKNGVFIFDCESRNGTWKNKMKLKAHVRYELQDSDELLFGQSTFQFFKIFDTDKGKDDEFVPNTLMFEDDDLPAVNKFSFLCHGDVNNRLSTSVDSDVDVIASSQPFLDKTELASETLQFCENSVTCFPSDKKSSGSHVVCCEDSQDEFDDSFKGKEEIAFALQNCVDIIAHDVTERVLHENIENNIVPTNCKQTSSNTKDDDITENATFPIPGCVSSHYNETKEGVDDMTKLQDEVSIINMNAVCDSISKQDSTFDYPAVNTTATSNDCFAISNTLSLADDYLDHESSSQAICDVSMFDDAKNSMYNEQSTEPMYGNNCTGSDEYSDPMMNMLTQPVDAISYTDASYITDPTAKTRSNMILTQNSQDDDGILPEDRYDSDVTDDESFCVAETQDIGNEYLNAPKKNLEKEKSTVCKDIDSKSDEEDDFCVQETQPDGGLIVKKVISGCDDSSTDSLRPIEICEDENLILGTCTQIESVSNDMFHFPHLKSSVIPTEIIADKDVIKEEKKDKSIVECLRLNSICTDSENTRNVENQNDVSNASEAAKVCVLSDDNIVCSKFNEESGSELLREIIPEDISKAHVQAPNDEQAECVYADAGDTFYNRLSKNYTSPKKSDENPIEICDNSGKFPIPTTKSIGSASSAVVHSESNCSADESGNETSEEISHNFDSEIDKNIINKSEVYDVSERRVSRKLEEATHLPKYSTKYSDGSASSNAISSGEPVVLCSRDLIKHTDKEGDKSKNSDNLELSQHAKESKLSRTQNLSRSEKNSLKRNFEELISADSRHTNESSTWRDTKSCDQRHKYFDSNESEPSGLSERYIITRNRASIRNTSENVIAVPNKRACKNISPRISDFETCDFPYKPLDGKKLLKKRYVSRIAEMKACKAGRIVEHHEADKNVDSEENSSVTKGNHKDSDFSPEIKLNASPVKTRRQTRNSTHAQNAEKNDAFNNPSYKKATSVKKEMESKDVKKCELKAENLKRRLRSRDEIHEFNDKEGNGSPEPCPKRAKTSSEIVKSSDSNPNAEFISVQKRWKSCAKSTSTNENSLAVSKVINGKKKTKKQPVKKAVSVSKGDKHRRSSYSDVSLKHRKAKDSAKSKLLKKTINAPKDSLDNSLAKRRKIQRPNSISKTKIFENNQKRSVHFANTNDNSIVLSPSLTPISKSKSNNEKQSFIKTGRKGEKQSVIKTGRKDEKQSVIKTGKKSEKQSVIKAGKKHEKQPDVKPARKEEKQSVDKAEKKDKKKSFVKTEVESSVTQIRRSKRILNAKLKNQNSLQVNNSKSYLPAAMENVKNASLKSKKHDNCFLMCTGIALTENQTKTLEDKLNVTIVSDLNDIHRVTHLVAYKARRTIKFLCALARGIHIYNVEWLWDSLAAGKLMPSREPYLLHDPEVEEKYQFSLKQSVLLARGKPLFEGYVMHVTPSVEPDVDSCRRIIQCAGGKYLDVLPKKNFPANLLVISCPSDLHLCQNLERENVTVLSNEFILTGLLRQKIEIDAYKLVTIPLMKLKRKKNH